jgi:putative endonuclease
MFACIAVVGKQAQHVMSKQNSTGQLGEDIAVSYLQQRGYTIQERNWRCTKGEIDIIATAQESLIFVEVRTRHAPNTEMAFASITPMKRQRMVRAVYEYLNTLSDPDQVEWRIDVVGVALQRGKRPHIQHVENAFDW